MSRTVVRLSTYAAFAFTGVVASVAVAAEDEEKPTVAEAGADFLQVQMHVWISETSEQGLRDLGTNLSYKRFPETSGDALQQVTTNVFDPENPTFSVTLPAPDPDRFLDPLRPDQSDGPEDGVQTQAGAGLTFSLIEDDHGEISGTFRAIEQNSDADLISKPELLVINKRPATIKAGGKVPFQDVEFDERTGTPNLNVKFEDIGVNMEITPRILNNGLIELELAQLDVTDLARFDNIRGIDLPVFSTRSQTGVVMVPNGEALVIGGLTSTVSRQSERRVPIVGKIPLIGMLFRGREQETINTHLMIFVAPTIVDLREISPAAMDALSFWEQGSWRNEQRIREEIDTLREE